MRMCPPVFCKRTANASSDAYGLLEITQVDPAVLSPGEFADRVRRAAEQREVSIVMIDSLNGHMSAMPSEQFLLIHMHELLAYLSQQGVVTLLVLAQHGMIGQCKVPSMSAFWPIP